MFFNIQMFIKDGNNDFTLTFDSKKCSNKVLEVITNICIEFFYEFWNFYTEKKSNRDSNIYCKLLK